MTVPLIWLACAAVAAAVSGRGGRSLARASALTRRNYRGLDVPTAAGIAVLLGLGCALGLLAVLRLLASDSERLLGATAEALPFAAAAMGFGLLGLWDDIAGGAGRGWRAHLGALRRGEATGGAVKLAGGVAVALVVVVPRGRGLGWSLLDAAIVALCANLFNLLDVRPGRSAKVFVVAAVGLLVVGGPTAPALAGALGAVVAFMPLDLRERAMLGDCGANALGAVVGYAVVAVGAEPARIATLVVLVGLHVMGDAPGISRAIAAVPALRSLDEAGRVPE